MTKHQPGPWHVYQDTAPGMEWNRHIHWAPNMTICFMAHSDRKDPERDEANANLVAAAPDLFEAALSAKDFLIRDLEEPGRTVFWKLIAALKKAGWKATPLQDPQYLSDVKALEDFVAGTQASEDCKP